MSLPEQASLFAALGDPVRLALLAKIGDGGSITELAAGLPITRQAVTRHLRVLERAELIQAQRQGRETRYISCPERLVEAKSWLDEVYRQWDGTLERFKAHVENIDRE